MSLLGALHHRAIAPAVAPGLLDASGLPNPFGSFGLRRLTRSYAGPGIRVRRSSDNDQLNIGFLSNGNLDLSTLSSFCAGAGNIGYVVDWYSQTSDNHLHTLSNSNQWRIFESGGVITKNGEPSIRAEDTNRGMVTNPFTAISSTNFTAIMVGAISNSSAPFSPRMLSLLPAGLADDDPAGLTLTRDGGTAAERWAFRRSAQPQVKGDGTYGQLSEVVVRLGGNIYTIVVDGEETAASGYNGSLNFTRFSIGYTGSSHLSASNLYISELLLFNSLLTTGQLSVASANHIAHFDTPVPVTPPPTIPSGLTLKAEDDFSQGFKTANYVRYNNGYMTKLNGVIPGVYMADCVTVENGMLRNKSQTLTTPIRLGGVDYFYKGGGWYWKGDPDGDQGSAFKRGGFWYYETRSDGPATAHGTADLLWPREDDGFIYKRPWPLNGEIDTRELYPGVSSKVGGEANLHLDVVTNGSRKLKIPTSEAHSPSPMVSAGNFQIDWKEWHSVGLLWIPGERIEQYIDGVRVGWTTDPRYVMAGTNAVPMRFGSQREGYGKTPAQRTTGTFFDEFRVLRYYSLN